MGLCDQPGLVTLDEALAYLQQRIQPIRELEAVALAKLDGRVLAAAVASPQDLPACDNSAMDGYALCGDGERWQVCGRAVAGHPYQGAELQPGQCIRIMTGADLPEGADRVVMQEQCQLDGDTLTVTTTVAAGDNIRRQGSDVRRGDEILLPGTRLGPAQLGQLASLGIDRIAVRRRPVVAVFATGDELVLPGQPRSSGQIYDANSTLMVAMLQRLGCEVLYMGCVADDESHLQHALAEADLKADLVVTSGGVSVGEADYSRQVVESMGELEVWRLAIKPGKPFAFGRLPNSWYMGLPGNPVSALVTLHQLGAAIVRLLNGEPLRSRHRCLATASNSMKKDPGRLDFQRGVYELGDKGIEVRALAKQNSAQLSAVSDANCFIVLEQQRGDVSQGEQVWIEPFDGLLMG